MANKIRNGLERMSVGRPTKYPTALDWMLAGIRRSAYPSSDDCDMQLSRRNRNIGA